MTKPGYIIGIIILSISGIMFTVLLLNMITGDLNETTFKYMLYSVIGFIIGFVLMTANTTSRQERQDYEDYKRMRQQENAIYYRFKDAKGKPIEEYLMDPRTKLITYYDRMPQKYKQKLLDSADTLYRRWENEEYTTKK